jgi:UPF0716 family protein affecting phage T7 exclusion
VSQRIALALAVVFTIASVALALAGFISPVIALLVNIAAVSVVWWCRATVARLFRPQFGAESSTGARRVTEILLDRS